MVSCFLSCPLSLVQQVPPALKGGQFGQVDEGDVDAVLLPALDERDDAQGVESRADGVVVEVDLFGLLVEQFGEIGAELLGERAAGMVIPSLWEGWLSRWVEVS